MTAPSVAREGSFELHAGALRFAVRADLGGAIAGLWHRDTPVLRSTEPALLDVSRMDYVRGVVSAESPSGWPTEALRAQAVAARTYAIATNAGGTSFDQYADTRSQVYGGVAAETASTDAAVSSTASQIVTVAGHSQKLEVSRTYTHLFKQM